LVENSLIVANCSKTKARSFTKFGGKKVLLRWTVSAGIAQMTKVLFTRIDVHCFFGEASYGCGAICNN
jgi:hypothetical protein